MADDFKTLREVGIAFQGVQRQLGLHTAVFSVAVLLAAGVSAFFYNKLDSVSASNASIDANVKATQALVDQKFVDLRALVKEHNDQIEDQIKRVLSSQSDLSSKIDKISLKLKVASADETLPSPSPVADGDNTKIAKTNDTAGVVAALRGKLGVKVLDFDQFSNDKKSMVDDKAKDELAKVISNGKWVAITADDSEWKKATMIGGYQSFLPKQ
jgi:hypothetical protein